MTADWRRDVAGVAIEPMTEPEMADRRRLEGFPVVCHRGRYWERVHHGFYQPVHSLARLKPEEVGRPAVLCWGFRTTLDATGAALANGALPVHLMPEAERYDIDALPAKRRTDLRKCRKLVEIVALTRPDILREQGREVATSSQRRTGYDFGSYVGWERYARFIERMVLDPKHVTLAGLVNGKLAGYLIGHAVGRVGYLKSVEIATEFLPTAIGTGLVFDFVQICRRSGVTGEILYGQHVPEDENLGKFKAGLGFPLARVPTRVWFPRIVRGLIRWRAPAAYYRLTGTTC